MAEVTARTPILQDKRLFLAAGAILSLVLSRLLNVDLSSEYIAGIVGTVMAYVIPSAAKEAQVSRALIAADRASSEVKTQADAAAVLRDK